MTRISLLNSPFLLQQSEAFARRVEGSASETLEARIVAALRNLAQPEDQLLSGSLYELQMKYVEVSDKKITT